MSPLPSGVLIDETTKFNSDNSGLIDIGKYSSIKDSKQIEIKKELEMPGSSKGRVESIPDIENGNTISKPKLSLQSIKSIHFEKGTNIEDASDEVRYITYFKNLNTTCYQLQNLCLYNPVENPIYLYEVRSIWNDNNFHDS